MKKLKSLDTRQRAVVSVLLLGFLVFFLQSPFFGIVSEFILPPAELHNIQVVQKQKEIDITWDSATEHDFKGYYITLNGQRITDSKLNDKSVDNYQIYNLTQDHNYSLQIGSIDSSGKISNLAQLKVNTGEKNTTYNLNPFDQSGYNTSNIAILAIFLTVLTVFLTNWVLFFKVEGKQLITISLYPAVALIPFIVLTDSLVLTLDTGISKSIFALGVGLGYVLVSYLLMLTANILNGSKIHGQIPLEQAAKASQFIVGLISTYLMMIYTFSSNLNLLVKIVMVLAFVYYFTYSALSSIKELSETNIVLRTLAVILTMFIAILAISVWPIESVYSILVIAIIYYIIFNVALEVRGKVGRSLWIEYAVLIGLITLLLFTNSVWGINGTII